MMAGELPPDKIYDRCAYLNCYNGKISTGHKLFRFPAYCDSRHNLWIRYTGNIRLRTWSSATIRRAGICADHFGRESFTDATRQSLRRHAVPKPYSATDAQAKASPTLLAHIKSLPRKRTRSRKLVEAEQSQKELMASQESSDPDDPVSAPEKPMPVQTHIADAVKKLRKVKMIKIEEKNSDSNRTVILERCKNPENCPASRQPTQGGEKSRPHFHKVYVNNTEITTHRATSSTSASKANPGVTQDCEKAVSGVRIIDESLEESCEDSTNVTAGDEEKSGDNMCYRLERYLINVTRSVPKKEITSADRKNGQTKLVKRRNIHPEKGETTMITIPDYISKKHPSTTELVKEYYRTKDERVFDRCAYLNCKNGRYTTGSRLFRFPQFTDPRLNTWIKNAGNPRMLYWSSATIRRAGLCSEHFSNESFFNETRQRLLRSALPKPFHLDSKNVSGTELQDENLTHDDLLKIFEGLDEDARDGTEPALIDLPDEILDHREDLKIKYPFEHVVTSDENAKEEGSGSFASVTLKNEPLDETEDDQFDELLSMTSERIDIKNEMIEEMEEDPGVDDASLTNGDDFDYEQQEDFDQAEDVQKIIALEQQKVELCKTIKQFSTKLKNAKLRKKKLRSQLLAYSEL